MTLLSEVAGHDKHPRVQLTQQSLQDRSLEKDYPHIAEALQMAFVIPGHAEDYIPQGIAWCQKREQYLLSHYYYTPDEERPKSPSVITIHNRQGELQRTIVLAESGRDQCDISNGQLHIGHVGGIAVSDNHLWVASRFRVFRFALSDIDAADDGAAVAAEMCFRPDARGSHVTVYRDWLWVGEFAHYSEPDNPRYDTHKHHHLRDRVDLRKYAWAAGYRFNQETGELGANLSGADVGLRPDAVISMRQKVQGMAFAPLPNDTAVVLSVSFGNNSSRLASYRIDLDGPPHKELTVADFPAWQPIPLWYLDRESYYKAVDAPRGSEELVFGPDGLAVVFEAGAERFLTRWTGHLEDRVLVLQPSLLLPEDE